MTGNGKTAVNLMRDKPKAAWFWRMVESEYFVGAVAVLCVGFLVGALLFGRAR